MGDVMLFGVLRMPYDMAMADEFTRYQYHQRGLQAADAIEALQAQLAEARDKARSVADAYDRANPMRTADIHRDGCDCLRCAVDAIRAMKGERG